MSNNIYIAVQVKENEKSYAYVIKTTQNNNLLSVLNIKGIISANIWNKTQAYKAVECWNESFKRKGIYMFDTPNF